MILVDHQGHQAPPLVRMFPISLKIHPVALSHLTRTAFQIMMEIHLVEKMDHQESHLNNDNLLYLIYVISKLFLRERSLSRVLDVLVF